MPPRKTIAKLQELAFAATSELVHVSCKKVEDEFPTPVDMDADTSGCKRAVQEMQNHLLRYIRPDDWEPMFQAVMELQQQDRILDQRIIYCTFINENTNLREMKFGYKHENFDLATVLKRPLVDFWLLQHLPLFTQLVEADFTDALCDNIPVICKALVNLETVTFPKDISEEIIEAVIKSCKKLRKIRLTPYIYGYGLMGSLAIETLNDLEYMDWYIERRTIDTLNQDRRLKLRNLKMWTSSVEHMKVMVKMCPLVEDIVVGSSLTVHDDAANTAILEVLTTSSMKIQKLNLAYFSITPALAQLCCSKATHLTSLTIGDTQGGNSLNALQNIAQACTSLSHLRLGFVGPFGPGDQTQEILFPKLEYFSILDMMPGEGAVSVALNCIANAPLLTTFLLALFGDFDEVDDNYPRCHILLTKLFSKARVTSLRNVTIWCGRSVIPLQLVQTICDSCKEMSSLKTSKLSEEAERFLEEVCKDAKARNEDFNNVTLDRQHLIELLS